MKSIKELEILVNFAKALGQTPDPEMVEQIREFHELQRKIVESVKANSAKDVNEAFGYDNKENINELVQEKTKIKRVPENYSTSLESGSRKITEGNEEQSATTGDSGQQPSTQTLADLTAKFISEAPKDSYQQPDIPLTTSSMKAVQDKLKFLEQWLSKISMTGPGGGAVNLKDLDDVSKYAVVNATQGQLLTYNAQSKLWVAQSHPSADEDTLDSVTTRGNVTTNGISVNSVTITANVSANIGITFSDSTRQTTAYTPAAFGSFWDNTTQTCGANIATRMIFGKGDGSSGVNLANANTRVVLSAPGAYNLQFSVQLTNTDNKPDQVFIWFRQNGTDIADSASVVTVPQKHGGGEGATIAAWNYFVTTTTPTEYAEIMWFTLNETKVNLRADVAANLVVGVSPPIPRIPSVILTVDQVR